MFAVVLADPPRSCFNSSHQRYKHKLVRFKPSLERLRYYNLASIINMPRILCHQPSLHKLQRRSSSVRQQSSSQHSMNSLNAVWHIWSGQQQSIAPASTGSAAPSTRSSSSSLANSDQTSRTRHSSHASSQQCRWLSFSEMDDGPWGQFVDTAEAEEEIIRHSKILSKRYSM